MLLPLIFVLAFLAVSVPVVAAPLWRAQTVASEPPGDSQTTSATSYGSTLLALRDLEFDHQLGVVNDDDYGQLHEQLVAEAAVALDGRPQAEREEAAAAIEAAIRARRERHPANVIRFCPQCGNRVDAGDHFCTGCGNPLR